MKNITFILGISIILFFSSFPLTNAILFLKKEKPQSSNSFDVILDYKKTNGVIKPFSEINCGPLPNYNIINGINLTKQYSEIGINFIRTHDFSGPTDISTIFPNFNADPNLESSYDFNLSDKYISSIVNSGSNVYYRFGESASNNEKLRQPPTDFIKWANVCKHIIMHYNDGWNNGFYYNQKYFEIWNEPDLNGFWNGTHTEYYQLFKTTYQTLKEYNLDLKIGGPCTSNIYDYNYTKGFLLYLLENNISLDFFSWHQYADTPNQIYKSSIFVRSLLDSYGFTKTENINSEWNINILTPQRDKDNAKNAAFTVCALTSFQDAEIDYVFRYRGTQDPNWLMRLIGFDLSLFSYDGIYKTPALSYLAFNYILSDTPIRLLTPIMDASTGFTYLAGISEDKTNVSIIISNFNSIENNYNLEITNLPWNSTYKIVSYVIDSEKHLEIFDEKNASSQTYSIEQKIDSNTVHFIRLTNTSLFPNEGPNVSSIPLILRLKILDPFTRVLAIFLMLFFFS